MKFKGFRLTHLFGRSCPETLNPKPYAAEWPQLGIVGGTEALPRPFLALLCDRTMNASMMGLGSRV